MPEAPTYTAAQVRAAEEPLLAADVPLMMRAAAVLAAVVGEELDERGTSSRLLVLAGSGNNGGDALFAVAALLERDRSSSTGAETTLVDSSPALAVDILRVGASAHEEGLAAAVAAGALVIDAAEASDRRYDVVIDGILGTGTRGAPVLRGVARDVVAALLAADPPPRVVAVDLPSGLHPDEGTTADGLVLPADVTVTFGGVKAGLARADGHRLAGRIVLADIGLADALASVAAAGEASVDRVLTPPT